MSLKGKMAMLGIDHPHGSEFINHEVVKLLGKLMIEQTKSRAGTPRRSTPFTANI